MHVRTLFKKFKLWEVVVAFRGHSTLTMTSHSAFLLVSPWLPSNIMIESHTTPVGELPLEVVQALRKLEVQYGTALLMVESRSLPFMKTSIVSGAPAPHKCSLVLICHRGIRIRPPCWLSSLWSCFCPALITGQRNQMRRGRTS